MYYVRTSYGHNYEETKSKSGKEYYELIDVNRINWNVVAKYVGYLGKSPESKVELTGKDMIPYVERLLDAEIPDSDCRYILEKIGIECGIFPITKITMESDRKFGRRFLEIK